MNKIIVLIFNKKKITHQNNVKKIHMLIILNKNANENLK